MTATGRRLELLALLQTRPGISADGIAARLGVTGRTARRDVAHLRELGYGIDGEPGRHGGYRLAAGTAVPPLLLDADEVAAVALGLRTAASAAGLTATSGAGLDDAAVTALAKLTQVTPARWRPRLDALGDVESVPSGRRRRTAADVLVTLALACRAREAVRIRHRRRPGAPPAPADVQPHRLVALRGVWYLVACRRGEDRWKVWALDRVEHAQPLGTRYGTPEPPADAAAFVAHSFAHAPWKHRVRVRAHTSGDLVRELVDPSVASVTDSDDGRTCELELRTDNLDWAARWLVYLNLDLDVLEPDELAERLRGLGRWLVERY